MAEPGRHALVVSSSRYSDPSLRALVSPTEDADALAELLRNRDVGDFRVRPVVDQPSWVVAREIEQFFADRRLNDIALFYFSGHGIKDEDGALYFATMDTDPKLLRTTTVPSEEVVAAMRRCRSRQQVLLLDCCFAGAFSKAMLAKSDERIGVQERFGSEGAGRVVIAASDAMQVAFEGGEIHGEPTLSVFTRVLVEGIETGKADQDGNGVISLDELYDYVYHRVRELEPSQEPTTSSLEKKGDIVIALNPRADSPPIPAGENDEEIIPPTPPEPIVPPPPGLITRTVNRAKDALGRVLRLPRRLWLAMSAAVLAVGVIVVAAFILVDAGPSDDWSLVDVAPATLDGPPDQVLRDVTVEPNSDRAVAVGSNGDRPGVWTYSGTSWSRSPQEIEGRSGQMNAVAASGETVVAAGSVNAGAEGVNGAIWTRSEDQGEWTRTCRRDVCGGNGKQEILAVTATSAGRFIAVGRVTGSRDGRFDAAVWLSDNGEQWRRRGAEEDDSLGGDLNQAMKGVAEIDGHLVAVGSDGGDGAAWWSNDGGDHWTLVSQAAFQAPDGDIELQAVETWDKKLIAVGRETEREGSKQYRAAAWFSDDLGIRWERASVPKAHFSGQQMVEVVTVPPGLVVAVGSDRSGSEEKFEAAVWQSQDGSEWTTVSSDSFAGPSGMTGVARLSSTTLFAVGTASSDGRIWVSEPGE